MTTFRTLIPAIALAGFTTLAQAQGVPVIDVAAIANMLQQLQAALEIPSVLIQLLVQRGINNYEEAIKGYSYFLVTPAALKLDHYNTGNYNTGYACFKKNDFANAELH